MRFMILVKATRDSEAGAMPEEKLIAAMASYHEELAKAGVLLDASGRQPTSKGWRIKCAGDNRTVTDGPFTETKELVAGYTRILAKSRAEALEWTRRFPNPAGEDKEAEIEVRQMFELDDFGPSKAIVRFREIDVATTRSRGVPAGHVTHDGRIAHIAEKETPCTSSPICSSKAAATRPSISTARRSAPR